MGGAGLPAGYYHPGRERGAAGRSARPQAPAAGRHCAVHPGVDCLRPGALAGVADCGTRGTGPGCRHHDGPDHGLCRPHRAQGENRQRHGPAGHPVGRGHGAGARPLRLAQPGAAAGGGDDEHPGGGPVLSGTRARPGRAAGGSGAVGGPAGGGLHRCAGRPSG